MTPLSINKEMFFFFGGGGTWMIIWQFLPLSLLRLRPLLTGVRVCGALGRTLFDGLLSTLPSSTSPSQGFPSISSKMISCGAYMEGKDTSSSCEPVDLGRMGKTLFKFKVLDGDLSVRVSVWPLWLWILASWCVWCPCFWTPWCEVRWPIKAFCLILGLLVVFPNCWAEALGAGPGFSRLGLGVETPGGSCPCDLGRVTSGDCQNRKYSEDKKTFTIYTK